MTQSAPFSRRLALLVLLAAQPVLAQSGPPSRSDFRSELRRLWVEHVFWTRLFVVSAVGNLPDKDATAKRLLKNQDDIAAALKPFYGDPLAARLGALLKEHVTVATLVVETTAQGDNTMRPTLTQRWSANADSIAMALSGANRGWGLDELKSMLQHHLEHTTAAIVARVQKDWAAEQTAFEKVHEQILSLADYLSNGIIRQFPRRFGS